METVSKENQKQCANSLAKKRSLSINASIYYKLFKGYAF